MTTNFNAQISSKNAKQLVPLNVYFNTFIKVCNINDRNKLLNQQFITDMFIKESDKITFSIQNPDNSNIIETEFKKKIKMIKFLNTRFKPVDSHSCLFIQKTAKL